MIAPECELATLRGLPEQNWNRLVVSESADGAGAATGAAAAAAVVGAEGAPALLEGAVAVVDFVLFEVVDDEAEVEGPEFVVVRLRNKGRSVIYVN